MDVPNLPSPENKKIPPPARTTDFLHVSGQEGRRQKRSGLHLYPRQSGYANWRTGSHGGRFHLAVLGQVKRGKSTLLNALPGEEILPSSVIPLTAIPTFIRFGEERHLTVRFNDSRPDANYSEDPACSLKTRLMGFVTESANPRNTKGVLEVEITHPPRSCGRSS